MGYMKDKIGTPAMYEQLAEECTELAQASLKMARILRKENPTPKTSAEVLANIVEEVSDIALCLKELEIYPDHFIIERKLNRFKERWGGKER